MDHQLPKLPYELNALEPVVSQRTMEFHYGKHLAGYITNLNSLIADTPFKDKSLEEIVKNSEGPIFNNAAQTWNHTFYFMTLSPKPSALKEGELMDAVKRDFGTLDVLCEHLAKASATLFGSGWAWLVADGQGKLWILQESNAGNPMTKGFTPLLTIDVWEHAYYLDYQNRRPDHVKELIKLIDWSVVEERYKNR